MKRNRMELSKNLLQMKFMQRTKDNVERERREKSDTKLADQEILDLCRKEGDRYLTTNSFLYCENLQYGRMSFKGMNSEIERLVESKRTDLEPTNKTVYKESADVSDSEMAAMSYKKQRIHRKR